MGSIVTQIAIGSAQTAQQTPPQTGASSASISGAAALHKTKTVVDSEAKAEHRKIDTKELKTHGSFEDQDPEEVAQKEELVTRGSGGKRRHLKTA